MASHSRQKSFSGIITNLVGAIYTVSIQYKKVTTSEHATIWWYRKRKIYAVLSWSKGHEVSLKPHTTSENLDQSINKPFIYPRIYRVALKC